MPLTTRTALISGMVMKTLCLAGLVPALSLSAAPANAQVDAPGNPRRTAGGELPPILKKTLGPVLSAFGKPVHPIIGGVAPGSGFGLGLGYDSPPGPWVFSAKAVGTARRYWTVETNLEYAGGGIGLDAYARTREMTQLAFYGFGNESAVDARTNYAMRERVVGGLVTVPVAPWIRLGLRAEENWANIGEGKSTEFPSIEDGFIAADIPGLTARAKYARYEASLNVRVPAGLGDAFHQGARYRVAYAHFDDHLANLYTFARWDAEAQHQFAMPLPRHRLTLHGWVSAATAQSGQEVPFYLQRTLGGKSFVRSMHDGIIGSDGSSGTLRGFPELRFRDRSVLLMQAEYRVPVWGPVDLTVYMDAGKVASDVADLDLTDLKRNYGFSVSVMKGARTTVRFDVAFRGGEGDRVFLTLGRGATR